METMIWRNRKDYETYCWMFKY